MKITERMAINYLQMRGYVVITKETEDLYHDNIRESRKLVEKANAQYLKAYKLKEETEKLVDEIKSGKVWLD